MSNPKKISLGNINGITHVIKNQHRLNKILKIENLI